MLTVVAWQEFLLSNLEIAYSANIRGKIWFVMVLCGFLRTAGEATEKTTDGGKSIAGIFSVCVGSRLKN